MTLTAVVALTLAACGSNTTETRGWSDETFGDLMIYCQAATESDNNCAALVLGIRDTAECSVEATYRVIDHILATLDLEALDDLMRDVLQPAGDCLGYDRVDDE